MCAYTFFIAFLVLTLMSVCDGYKVLLMFPLPGKSHTILGQGIARHLVSAGHDVTFITVNPKEDTELLHHVDVSANTVYIPDNVTDIRREMDKTKIIGGTNDFLGLMKAVYVATLKNKNVQNIFNDPKQEFDVIIAEWMFNELYAGIQTIYQCPFIWVSTIEPHWGILSLIDQAPNPAYVPNAISSNAPPYGFRKRVNELVLQTFSYLFKEIYRFSEDAEHYEKIFGPIAAKKGKQLPPYEVIKYNASLVLGNSHVSLGQAVPLPQSYKAVAGWHVQPEVEPLPEDLKKIMDNSKHGVIYFSLGSQIRSRDIPKVLRDDLFKMFSELKQTVLWKFEVDLPDLPKNVHLLQWAPQQAILMHPNLRMFITHGGLLSVIETLYYGVPIIGIPVFADQFVNIDRAVKKGFARKVELSYEMKTPLKIAIEEVLSDPKYTEKVKELSFIYHDRPAPPGKELVHWVEHVIRTRGAPHLRSPALMVTWYQKLYLDLFGLVSIVLFVLYTVLKRSCLIVCSNNKTNEKKKKN